MITLATSPTVRDDIGRLLDGGPVTVHVAHALVGNGRSLSAFERVFLSMERSKDIISRRLYGRVKSYTWSRRSCRTRGLSAKRSRMPGPQGLIVRFSRLYYQARTGREFATPTFIAERCPALVVAGIDDRNYSPVIIDGRLRGLALVQVDCGGSARTLTKKILHAVNDRMAAKESSWPEFITKLQAFTVAVVMGSETKARELGDAINRCDDIPKQVRIERLVYPELFDIMGR